MELVHSWHGGATFNYFKLRKSPHQLLYASMSLVAMVKYQLFLCFNSIYLTAVMLLFGFGLDLGTQILGLGQALTL